MIYQVMKENKGLTLVEVLVSITILSLIVLPMFSFFSGAYKYKTNNQNNSLATHVARNVLQYMEKQDFNRIKSLIPESANTFTLTIDHCSEFTSSHTCKDVFQPTINNVTYDDVEVELKLHNDVAYQNLLLHVNVRVSPPEDQISNDPIVLEGLIAHESIR